MKTEECQGKGQRLGVVDHLAGEVRGSGSLVKQALRSLWRETLGHYRAISRPNLSFGLLILRFAVLAVAVPQVVREGGAARAAGVGACVVWLVLVATRHKVHSFCAGHPTLGAFIDAACVLMLCAATGYASPFFPLMVTPPLTLAIYFVSKVGAVRRTILQATAFFTLCYAALILGIYRIDFSAQPVVFYDRATFLLLFGVVCSFSAVLLEGHTGLYDVARAMHVPGLHRVPVAVVTERTCLLSIRAYEAFRMLQAEIAGDHGAVAMRAARLANIGTDLGERGVFRWRCDSTELDLLGLTEMERRVLRWRALGLDEAQIARQSDMPSQGTVKSHLDSISSKVGDRSGPRLTALALDAGLITARELHEYAFAEFRKRRVTGSPRPHSSVRHTT